MMDEEYLLSGQSASEEAYYYAGTHRLPQATLNYSSTTQVVEEDVNASLIRQEDINENADPELAQLGLDSPIDLQQLDTPDAGFWSNNESTPFYNAQDLEFDLQPPKRTNSDLRATAAPFIPAARQWQSNRPTQFTSMPQQKQNGRVQLTPLNTNVSSIWQTPPYSAPSRAAQAYPTAVSPMISLNDELTYHQFPHSAMPGVQWPFATPPALAIDTWAQQQTTFQPNLIPNSVDPAMLTPVTPTYGGSTRERSGSRTATSGMYLCDHEGCVKEFKSRTEWTHHKRNHGERHHVCDTCDKRFVFRKDLNRHIKTHSPNDRQFFCSIHTCPWATKGFQRKDHYDRHLKTHFKTGMLTPSGSSAPMSRSPSRR